MAARWLRDKRVWIVFALVAAILALRLAGFEQWLTLETLRTHRAALTAWVDAHWALAALAYVAAYIGIAALALPGAALMSITGGFLFGTVAGTLLTVIGATAGATVVFLLARSVFGDRALDRFGATATRLAAGIRRNAWSYLLVLRFVPLFPFFLVNLVPAFVGVRLPVFVGTTFIGIIPGTAVFSLAGAGLGSVLDAGGAIDLRAILTPEILGGLIGLAAISLLAIPLRNRFAPPEP